MAATADDLPTADTTLKAVHRPFPSFRHWRFRGGYRLLSGRSHLGSRE
jgi:hypothetical protein